MDSTNRDVPAPDEIRLKDLLGDFRRARIRSAVVTIVCGALGAAIGLARDKQFEATTVVSPVTQDASAGHGALSSLASQYSDLASLAGISMPSQTQRSESVAMLRSELIAQGYIRDQNLLPVLYAQKWDGVSKQWKVSDKNKIPTLWMGYQYFRKNIQQVVEDKSTGLVTLRITWKDPQFAAKWANDLVKATNEYLRGKAIRESERNIAYLTEQGTKTIIVEARQAIYSLLQQEINKEMVALGREEFALRVIDPAFVPEKPSSLGTATLTVLGLLFGAVLSTIIIFVRRVLLDA
jgi:uncharacterized protein involved in exopolysaccharide biosynthesis